jgi:hypothetical protein
MYWDGEGFNMTEKPKKVQKALKSFERSFGKNTSKRKKGRTPPEPTYTNFAINNPVNVVADANRITEAMKKAHDKLNIGSGSSITYSATATDKPQRLYAHGLDITPIFKHPGEYSKMVSQIWEDKQNEFFLEVGKLLYDRDQKTNHIKGQLATEVETSRRLNEEVQRIHEERLAVDPNFGDPPLEDMYDDGGPGEHEI